MDVCQRDTALIYASSLSVCLKPNVMNESEKLIQAPVFNTRLQSVNHSRENMKNYDQLPASIKTHKKLKFSTSMSKFDLWHLSCSDQCTRWKHNKTALLCFVVQLKGTLQNDTVVFFFCLMRWVDFDAAHFPFVEGDWKHRNRRNALRRHVSTKAKTRVITFSGRVCLWLAFAGFRISRWSPLSFVVSLAQNPPHIPPPPQRAMTRWRTIELSINGRTRRVDPGGGGPRQRSRPAPQTYLVKLISFTSWSPTLPNNLLTTQGSS